MTRTPLTGAQRQARYRQANRDAGIDGHQDRPMTQLLSTVIDLPAKRALERIADWRGVTQRQALQDLIAAAESALLHDLSRTGDTGQYWRTVDQAQDRRALDRRTRRQRPRPAADTVTR